MNRIGRDPRDGDLSRWLVRRQPTSSCRARLVVFPFAGGGASAFAKWPVFFPPQIEVVCVQPPGREDRLAEPPLGSVAAVTGRVDAALDSLSDRPMAFFGHSMGALLAFHTALRRQSRGAGAPTHLFVSSCRAPHLGQGWKDPRSLTDAILVERLRDFAGTPQEVFDHPALLALVLPTIRSDLTLTFDFRPLPRRPVGCPIVALGGDSDPHVSSDELDAWSEHTRAGFNRQLFPGGHFYIQQEAAALAAHVVRTIGGPDLV